MRGMKTGIRGKVAVAIFWAARAWGVVSMERDGEGWCVSAHWAMARESERAVLVGRRIVGTVQVGWLVGERVGGAELGGWLGFGWLDWDVVVGVDGSLEGRTLTSGLVRCRRVLARLFRREFSCN